jgi:hypothetical protein
VSEAVPITPRVARSGRFAVPAVPFLVPFGPSSATRSVVRVGDGRRKTLRFRGATRWVAPRNAIRRPVMPSLDRSTPPDNQHGPSRGGYQCPVGRYVDTWALALVLETPEPRGTPASIASKASALAEIVTAPRNALLRSQDWARARRR